MIKLNAEKNNCCGCSACAEACPQKAITLKCDEKSFLYPEINMSKCVGCGLCDTVCPMKNQPDDKSASPKAVAVKNTDEKIRLRSRSGGVFAALAYDTLEKGGVVFGAGFGNHFKVIHKCVESASQIADLQGVKYTQSDMNNYYSAAKQLLEQGRKVLFSGTPCQIAGLINFLGKLADSELLLTADLVCHGVNSPLFWQDYLNKYENKYGKITTANFRDKQFGWQSHFESFIINNKKYVDNKLRILFYKHLTLRESCGVCPYAKIPRISDITLADFWGMKSLMPDFDDKKGVSLILINTNKGKAAVDAVADKLEMRETEASKLPHENLKHPSVLNPERKKFWNDYFTKGFDYSVNKYCSVDNKTKLKDFMQKHGLYK